MAKPDMFQDYKNLFDKTAPLRAPEEYDDVIFIINRYFGMNNALLPAATYISRYLWSARGRCYYLLYGIIPPNAGSSFTKYVKREKLQKLDAIRVGHLQRHLSCNGKDAYISMLILKKQGIDIDRIFGIDLKDK